MEVIWLLIPLFVLPLYFLTKTRAKHRLPLPPGLTVIPIVGNLIWLTQSMSNIESILQDLHARYGPIITLRLGSRLSINISDRYLAHSALITHGATFAGRPKQTSIREILNVNYHTISTATYGPLWRLLRRNLAGEVLQPSHVKLLSSARKWTVDLLKEELSCSYNSNSNPLIESFHLAMFSLLVYMFFGERLDEGYVNAIKSTQRDAMLYFARKLNIFSFMPMVTKYLYRDRWNKALSLRKRQKELFMPLIESRRVLKTKSGEDKIRNADKILEYCYVDTLLDTRLPDEGGRLLSDDDLVALCGEFLVGGTDTTSTVLKWIMAELVKNQDVQSKLWHEIQLVLANSDSGGINEEMLEKMPYLKAVVLEALRLHPPSHFLLNHAVTQECTLGGYTIPRRAWVNFLMVNIGRDEKIWKNPTEFKPERFLEGGEGEGVDITGTKEIKMMPFGAGRRICPGLGIAMLHLEYIVANMVKEFEWRGIEGEEVDLAEKLEFTVVMKKPFRAQLTPRN
ncbi:Cytochrome P450 89A2 [Rhynchospora pubera]|uniref:Cytochrome P450 89A2 n=1 Tax=Rhynchospora pubera TaxID=906938 RepID=A0AAV8E7U4_9POAL|nr:Cytochrome P450 89A2 [Rhynchospora pubera]